MRIGMADSLEKTNGSYIVGLMKAQRDSVFYLLNVQEVDFLGASIGYVEEKIDAQIDALKMLKKQLRRVDKRQSGV